MASLGKHSLFINFVFIVLYHCTCVCGQERSTTVLKGGHISFAPLPEGEPYRSTVSDDNWILSSYEEIAKAVILALKDELPYDVIKEEVWTLRGKSDSGSSDIINKALVYELPFVILGGISLLCSILIPLVGLVFCCCRCCGRCGGKLEEENMEFSPVKRRQYMALGIVLCCVFMAIGGTGIILSSERLGSSTPTVKAALLDSVDDIITYKNNTIAELKRLVGPDMTFAVNLIADDLEDVSSFIGSPVLDEARKKVSPIVSSLTQLGTTISETKSLLENVNVTAGELVELGRELRHQLQEARQNLTNLKTECDANIAAKNKSVCDKIAGGEALHAGADFTQVPSVTDELENVNDVLKIDIAKEAQSGNKTFEEITQNIKETTKSGREEILNFTRELEDLSSDMISSLSDIAEKKIEDTLLPAKKEIERSLGTNGVVEEHDKYRFIGLLSLACTVLFIVILTFIALTCGVLGASPSDTPTNRSNTANCAGKTLMWCVALFVIISFFINLPLGALFVLGSNLTVMCKATRDLTLIEKTIDDPTLLGYYPVSKALLGDGDIKVQISSVLRGCGDSKTPWMLLKLDKKFDLENMTSYEDKIPPIDEIFEKLNSTIVSTSVLTDKAKKNLNDTRNVGIDDIDFGNFSKQIEKPLVNVSLTHFAENLTKSAAEIKAMGLDFSAIGDKMQFIAYRLLYIQSDIVEASQTLVNILKEKVEELKEMGNETMREVDAVTDMWEDLQRFLATDALLIANKAAKRFMDRILGWIDQYLENTVNKVRNNVGNCKPLKNLYDVTIAAVCGHAVSALNAFWLSLGVIAVFSVITMILCVRLAKHYRRALRSSRVQKIGHVSVRTRQSLRRLVLFAGFESSQPRDEEIIEQYLRQRNQRLKNTRHQVLHRLAITKRAVEPEAEI